MTDEKIILFPTERIVNPDKAKENAVQGEKVRIHRTKEFVEMAMKTEKPEFTKDLGLLVDIMRGMIYRDFDVEHPAQKLSDKIVDIKITKYGPQVWIDYNRVLPQEMQHKPHKPLSNEIKEEIKKRNEGWTDFEPDFPFPDDE